MLKFTCPYCGPRPQSEFTFGRDATAKRPEGDADTAAWLNYVFLRDDPKGVTREYWQHTQGCRAWLVVERDTLTHETLSVTLAKKAGD